MTETEIKILIDTCEDEIRRNNDRARNNVSMMKKLEHTNSKLAARNKYLRGEMRRLEDLLFDSK